MIELKLFGRFEMSDEAHALPLESAKLIGLLAVLAVAGDRPTTRETLADLLWGSHFEVQARQNLRQALSRLRRTLGADCLQSTDQHVLLDPLYVNSDYARFDRSCRSELVEELQEAARIGAHGFLDGIAVREPTLDEWITEQRRFINERLRKVHRKLAMRAMDRKDAGAALVHAEDLLRCDPLDEEGHRFRLTALAELGRRNEALQHHQSFERDLKRVLGAHPDDETRSLVESIRSNTASSTGQSDERPSIAVMPFANLSAGVEQGYFADGMSDELITGLSCLPWLKVISRSSTFIYRDRSVDVRQVASDLKVRYVLEGSVRRAENKLRITGQLIDAESGLSIWAAHFDGDCDRIFELQDQVALKVIGAIQPRLEHAELERSRRRPTTSLGAYDYYLRGLAEVHRWTQEANGNALKFFYKAIELDRHFAAAYGMAARCLSQRKTSGWVVDEERERTEAAGLANLAVEHGPRDPVALASAGIALAFVVGRVREGRDLIDRSLSINPGHTVAWMYSSWVNAWSGEWERAIACARRALELSPHDPYVAGMLRANAFAEFIGMRYQDAIETAEGAATSPQNAAIGAAAVAASAALLGKMDRARAALATLMAVEPKLRVSNLRSRFPILRDDDFIRFSQALQLAGLPE